VLSVNGFGGLDNNALRNCINTLIRDNPAKTVIKVIRYVDSTSNITYFFLLKFLFLNLVVNSLNPALVF